MTKSPADKFIDSCFGWAPSRWDNPLYRRAAMAGYQAAERKLMDNVPSDQEEFLARALSSIRAKLGA
jgi:hypothetical protein